MRLASLPTVKQHHTDPFFYLTSVSYFTPCLSLSLYTLVGVVSQLLVKSRTSLSLSLLWDRPDYFTASLRGLVYYEPLLLPTGSGSGRWLYVDSGSSSDELPALQGLEELTNYSIRMAVFDSEARLCVFNHPLVTHTGKSFNPFMGIYKRHVISFLQQFFYRTFLHPTHVRRGVVVYSQYHL